METFIEKPIPTLSQTTSKLKNGFYRLAPRTGHKKIPAIKLPLHVKLIGAISLLMCLFMATVILTVNQHMRQSILDEFLKRGLSVARNLAALNTSYITTYNYVKIEQNVEFMVKENDLLYATILFFDGEPAAYSGDPGFKQTILDGPLSKAAFESQKTLVQYDSYKGISFCEIAVPIILDKEKWGTVRVGFPLDNMQVAIDHTERVLLVIGIIALVAGCLAALFLSRRITRPVGALVNRVEALSKGDYDSTFRVNSRDEIGYLADRFASMQETVKDNISLLERSNRELSLSNQKLNHEIEERSKAEDALRHRDAVLTVVSYAAEQLLKQHDWRASIPEIFSRLGSATGMHAISLLRCGDIDCEDQLQVVYAWQRNAQPTSTPPGTVALAQTTGEKIPLTVTKRLWGYVIFELPPLMRLKGASDTTVGAMRTIAGNLEAAMERREALESLKKANHAKDDFLANMSHELRTPLNHIIGFTELIVDHQFGELNEMQTEYLSDVLSSSKHLLSLINDILDLSKIEAGKIKFEPERIDIRQVLENSLFMVKERAFKQNIKLSLSDEVRSSEINADERMLKQVLYNLLGNAVKFTPKGGAVTLEARQVERYVRAGQRREDGNRYYIMKESKPDRPGYQKQSFLSIAVSDSGIGIAPENLTRVFNRFDQVESNMNRKYPGTGLGLALVKNFVELHRGRIWAESQGHKKGSTFRFLIPI